MDYLDKKHSPKMDTHFLFYKNIVDMNIQAESYQIIKNILTIFPVSLVYMKK